MLGEWGHKPIHARRLLRRFYARGGAREWDGLSIPLALQQHLARDLVPPDSRVVTQTVAGDGTTKLLVGFPNGAAVETVLMPDVRPDRTALCVSSQVGCAMGCDFCASTKAGLVRNLHTHEIVEQFLHAKNHAARDGRRVTSLVFMGMGEPMHNLDAVLDAIRIIADPDAGGVGWRQVTVSTVGIVAGIDRLAEADLNVHLALSLHAPDDATRARIVPTGRRFTVTEIIGAGQRFFERTGRVVTIEYCLLAGVNDSDEQAVELARLLAGFRAHVNVIPYNAIGAGLSGAVYARPSPERVDRFVNLLREHGTVTHVRRTRGGDRHAACGQLRLTTINA
jgi:23S rRNA (adenine2503-C2)-methyltransferase